MFYYQITTLDKLCSICLSLSSFLSVCYCCISDDTKIGQKLLEKMGWRKGNALGLKEDGIKEHVKVSTKSDRKGL